MLPFALAAALVSVVESAAMAAGALKPMVVNTSATAQHSAVMMRCVAVLSFISALSFWLVMCVTFVGSSCVLVVP